MVPFILAALLHTRTHTDDLWLIEKLYLRRTVWTDHLLRTVDHVSVGPSGSRERRGEKGEAMGVKKRIVCKKVCLIDYNLIALLKV